MSDSASKGLSPRVELLRLQKRIFVQNDRLIRSEAVVEEPGFAAYERRYRRHVADYEVPVEIEDAAQQPPFVIQRQLNGTAVHQR